MLFITGFVAATDLEKYFLLFTSQQSKVGAYSLSGGLLEKGEGGGLLQVNELAFPKSFLTTDRKIAVWTVHYLSERGGGGVMAEKRGRGTGTGTGTGGGLIFLSTLKRRGVLESC